MQPGTRIGPYEVIAALGAGGMGEVWRARDARLGRDVALKVLPEGFADDAERLARFEREAKTLASLDHPGIAHVYGLETGDSLVIVMELVEGEDLSQRLQRGPMPVDEALPVARQIAEALEAAHEAGVVHRDLKPANVKVRPDGSVKVLDFGLAKATAAGSGSGTHLANSPTLMSPAVTQAGVIMGTAAYMAPEQAKGGALGPRADVWAFGVMLHEMLTGQRMFEGETVAETLAGVLRGEIALEGLPPDTPASVRWLIDRCLQRDPRKRLAAVGEAARVLADPESALGGRFAAAAPPAGSRIPWVAAGLAAGAIVGAVAINMLQPTPPPSSAGVHRFALPVGDGAPEIASFGGRMVALSDDGSLLTYTDLTASPSRQWLRSMASGQSELLQLRNAVDVRFSPNPRFLAAAVVFSGTLRLFRVDRSGGEWSREDSSNGFDWLADGTLIYFRDGALWRSTGQGAEPAKITDVLGIGSNILTELDVLPGDEAVVATRLPADGADGARSVVAISLRSGEIVAELASNAISGQYVPSGHLLFARGLANRGEPDRAGTLMAAPFDAAALRLTGEPVPVVLDLGFDSLWDIAQYDVSDRGTLAYVPFRSRRTLEYSLVRVAIDGSTQEVVSEEAVSMNRPRLAPDGRRAAVQVVTPERGLDIWVYDLDRAGARLRLTDEGDDYDPVWHPDGRTIYFSSNRGEREQLFSRRSDGGGAETLVIEDELNVNAHSWHPDGVTLAYYARARLGSNRDIGLLHLDESPVRAETFLATEANERGPVFSPDGKWIAWASDQSGRDEIYLTDYPERSSIRAVSTGGGREPAWAPDGRALFYRFEDDFYRVDVHLGAEPRLGTPVLFASGTYTREVDPSSGSLSYDVTADGSLLVVRPEGRTGDPSQVMLVLNFFEELARLAPGSR